MSWSVVSNQDVRARALADRHYSRQRPGARQFMPPGQRLVLLTDDARAVWGVALNLDPVGVTRWRCTLFRNEGDVLSSELVREATAITIAWWRERYTSPDVPLTTEVDVTRTRRKRDPGRCFLRAGWRSLGPIVRAKRKVTLVRLVAPGFEASI